MTAPPTDPPVTTRQRRRWSIGVAAAVFILVVAVIVVLQVQATRSLRAEAAAARRAVAAGRLEAAQAALTRWLRREPGSAEAHLLLAQVELAQGGLRQALREADRARTLGQPEADTDRVRGLVLARGGRLELAEPLLARLWHNARGPDPDVDAALARIYLETYRFGAAGEVLARWMRDAPADPRPYLWRTEITRRIDSDPAPLVRDYQAALDRDPNLDEARLGLANALRDDRRFAEAAQAFETYLRHRPDDPAGHLGAGRNALEQGDEAAARRHLDRALELKPDDADALLARASIDLHGGNSSAALERIDQAIRLDPHEPEPHYRRANVLARLGRQADARAERETADRLRRDKARLTEIREGLVKSPNDTALQIEAARWLIDHGHGEEGVRWAQRVLQAHPADATANRLLADYYTSQGNAGLANFYRAAAPQE